MQRDLIPVEVTRSEPLAENIRRIDLVRAGGGELPAFEAGAHVDVHLPNGLIRQYSLWNDPADNRQYCLGVLLEPAGRGGSAEMHRLRCGDRIKVSWPRNNFRLVEADDIILLAGGIGVTPLLSMAQYLYHGQRPFTLHYCARSPERMAFQEWLRASGFAAKVQLHFDNGPAEQRFDFAALSRKPPRETHLYVCGPTGFMDAALSAAEGYWPETALHREYFAAKPTATGEDQPFFVQLRSTGETFGIPAGQSIAEVLERHGIDVPRACEQGICGTCMTPVLKGIPDHRDLVMTAAEHAQNHQMTLCCSRAQSELLVLDL